MPSTDGNPQPTATVSPNQQEAAMAEDTETAKVDTTDDADLGDAGKKALDAERKARRDAERKAQDLEKRLAALEDAEKTETQKLADRLAEAEKRAEAAAAKLDRLEVALDKAPIGMAPTQIRNHATRLAGTTRDELEADAEEWFSQFQGDDTGDKKTEKPAPTRKPRENLRTSGGPIDQQLDSDPLLDALKGAVGAQ